MAAVTSAVIAAGTAGYQIFSAERQKKEAKEAIENFERQDLDNPFKNIQISTLKAEQQTEANNVNLATSVDALQRAGTRGVLGGIPRINQQNILLQNLISADLERQDVERSRLIAQGEARIQGIQENRENLALQGLGQQLQTARQDSATGIANLASGILAFGSATQQNGGIGGSGGGTPQQATTETTNPLIDTSVNFSDFFNTGGDINASLFDNTNTLLS